MGYDVSRGLSGAGAGASIGTAIAPGIGTAIGGGIGLLTGFLGGGDDGSELYRQAAAQYDNIVPPEFRRDIEMLELQQGGRLTPEQLERLPQEMQEAYLRKGDAETKQKQAVQLDAMKEYAETGYSPQQALELAKVRNQVNADIKSRLADIKQKGQYYGGLTGGQSLAAELQAGQDADTRAAMESLQIASDAARSKEAMLQNYYQNLSGFRGQEENREAANVEAQNLRQRFDIENSRANQLFNAQQRAAAQLDFLNRSRTVADTNTQQKNAWNKFLNYELPQNEFENKMKLAGGKAAALAGQAQAQSSANAASAQGWGQAMTGLAQMGSAYGQCKATTDAAYIKQGIDPKTGQKLG